MLRVKKGNSYLVYLPQQVPTEKIELMRTTLLIATATMLVAAPAWAVNKCKGPDGKVSFQDAPCSGQGEKIEVRPASGHADPAKQGDALAQRDKLKADNAMAEAIRTHKPLVGMTAAQLQESMGTPTRVNASNYNGVLHDQLIYERPGETWYVYTRNGRLEAFQHTPAINRAPQAASGPCPTAHEIRSAEISATSMTVGDAERAERLRAIAEMKKCGRR